MLFANSDIESSPIIMAIRVVKKGEDILVGLAFADASTRKIGVSQFLDNDLFSNAEVCIFWTVYSVVLTACTSPSLFN